MVYRIKEYYLKYKELINYLVFGILSTVVNFVTFFVCNDLLKIDELISNVIAWVVAVLFAYLTNRKFVFESSNKDVIKEIFSFFICRILTLLITDIGIFALLVKVFSINVYVVKVINQIIVTILNYVFSKVFIFKNKE